MHFNDGKKLVSLGTVSMGRGENLNTYTMAFVLSAIEVDQQALSIRSAGVHCFLVLGKAQSELDLARSWVPGRPGPVSRITGTLWRGPASLCQPLSPSVKGENWTRSVFPKLQSFVKESLVLFLPNPVAASVSFLHNISPRCG